LYDDEVTAVPRNEDHFWAMAEDNYEHARHILNDYVPMSRDDALAGGKRAPMIAINYRNISQEYDQRDYFLRLGRATLPIVRELLDKREVSVRFVQEWGKLMFCHGLIAGYVFDDSDDLAPARASAGSARKKREATNRARRWLARVHTLPQFSALARKEADFAIAEAFASLAASAEGDDKKWFGQFLQDADGQLPQLRRKFSQQGLGQDLLIQLALQNGDDLPPLPVFPISG